ncbi:GPP34 family phosphoprotein [Actinophytocola sp. NPDC049390]|uniref:GOLPH3/VPS74 family protein n=1 Tax=Actinophytocola sp. NPDC049390 TaxID=3363894 RepID=UPI00379F7A62
MALAEDLLVLLVGKSSGELPRRSGTQSALAAAVLVELVECGRVVLDDQDLVHVVSAAPVGDPLLDGALGVLVEGLPVVDAVAGITPPGLYVWLLDRLVARGILAPRARNFVPLGSKYVWRVVDTAPRERLRGWLAGVLAGHTALNQWSAALISLLYAVNAVDVVVEGSDAFRRADEISRSGWAASAVVHPLIDRSHLFADFSGMPGPMD